MKLTSILPLAAMTVSASTFTSQNATDQLLTDYDAAVNNLAVAFSASISASVSASLAASFSSRLDALASTQAASSALSGVAATLTTKPSPAVSTSIPAVPRASSSSPAAPAPAPAEKPCETGTYTLGSGGVVFDQYASGRTWNAVFLIDNQFNYLTLKDCVNFCVKNRSCAAISFYYAPHPGSSKPVYTCATFSQTTLMILGTINPSKGEFMHSYVKNTQVRSCAGVGTLNNT